MLKPLFSTIGVCFCVAAVKCVSFVSEKNINPELQVETFNGLVQGRKGYMNGNHAYFAFQGIPYAKPPLNNLRFQSPRPIGKWPGILDASKEQSSCVEVLFRSQIFVNGSEDCLYLNVFTPQKPTKIERSLPVMVWIHGGAFIEGNSREYFYGPETFLSEDVIIVTLNYRIGIFGFLSTANIDSPGNYGLKDQNLAMRWVKRNIKRFGGNPNNITLFGQSAGGASVFYHLQSPKSKGLFQKAIAESGTSLCSFALQVNPLEIAIQVAEALGVNTNNTKEMISQMRKIEVGKIVSAQATTTMINIVGFRKYGLPYSPTIEPKHKHAFLTEYSYEALINGNFTKVPVLTGLNSKESISFTFFLNMLRPILNLLYDTSPGMMAMPNLNTKSYAKNREFGLVVKNRYFKKKTFTDASYDEILDFFSDDIFFRPIRKATELLSTYIPVYFYIFTYEGRYATNGLQGAVKREAVNKGVSHSEELWYLWNRKDIPLIGKNDQRISRQVIKLWTNFAKFGNPTPVKDPLLDNITWPVITPSRKMVHLSIDRKLSINDHYRDDYVDFWEDIYTKFGHRPFKTY